MMRGLCLCVFNGLAADAAETYSTCLAMLTRRNPAGRGKCVCFVDFGIRITNAHPTTVVQLQSSFHGMVVLTCRNHACARQQG